MPPFDNPRRRRRLAAHAESLQRLSISIDRLRVAAEKWRLRRALTNEKLRVLQHTRG